MLNGTKTSMKFKDTLSLPNLNSCTIGILGLGYVGLPLAVAFSTTSKCFRTGLKLKRKVIGFDINTQRVDSLNKGIDRTNELSSDELLKASNLLITSNIESLYCVDIFIVTVPTPIDVTKNPDLSALKSASKMIGEILSSKSNFKRNTVPIVIYESTVYPGATEEICVPIIEEYSGLIYNKNFFCGYSPERINPGDKTHRLTEIKKVTSGSNLNVAKWIDNLYGSIIKAGTYIASSIKVAEAAKVIENTQRDINIALINELAIIFQKLNIDTLEVLEAANTKWNFLDFKPGLVGGHCIGVDPYYLTYKAQSLGYNPRVVLAGRRINDEIGGWIIEQLVIKMAQRKMNIGGTKVLILGITFKENCPDMRNSGVANLIKALKKYDMQPVVVDPLVDITEAENKFGVKVFNEIPLHTKYSAIIGAVCHKGFKELTLNEWTNFLESPYVIYDLKGFIPRELNTFRL